MPVKRQTKLKLRKGFDKAPITYKVLAVNLFTDTDNKIIAKTLMALNTDKQAQAVVTKIEWHNPWGFSYAVSLKGPERIGILTYKGVEVALFFKRYTVDVVPAPEDPVPEGALENLEDVWIRFDLFGQSIRQQHKTIRNEIITQERELQLCEVALKIETALVGKMEQQIKSLQTQLNAKKGKK